jgi:hypothetical protein
MQRNSAGQVIVKESGSLLLSIPCLTSTISINTYNRFLLDEREFTELVPTIDKDALINKLENDIVTATKTINVLSANLTQEKINSIGGCNVGIRVSSSAAPNKTYNNKFYGEKIGFDILSSADGVYYNAIQSNNQPIYDITNKQATIYQDAQSRSIYTLKASIKYRYRYVGLNQFISTADDVNVTKIQFWKFTNGSPAEIGDGVAQIDDITGTYKPGDITDEYSINLSDTNIELGGNTDIIYLPVLRMPDNFIMEILPGSTFTILPE